MTMRALANAESGVVKAEIELAAPPERVFHALTDPAELTAWWGADEMYRTHDWKVDLRPGGSWGCRARAADGSETTVGGEYIEIDPPRLLVYTWVPSWDGFVETTVRCELDPIATGTRLRITHTGFTDRATVAEGTSKGWTLVLGWLAERVER